MITTAPPTADRARFLFNYQSDTGRLTWRNPTMRAVSVGDVAGSLSPRGYRHVSVDGRLCMAHRLVWLIAHGEWPDADIVARNGDYDDMRLANFYIRANKELSQEEQEARDQRRASELVRYLWKRTCRDHPSHAWTSLDQFRRDIGSDAFTHCCLVSIRDAEPIGPGNFRIERRAKFDRNTPEGRKAYYDNKNRANSESKVGHHRRSRFGISPQEYQEMVLAHNGVCAICKKPETALRGDRVITLSVDHCHATGVIRGLLCRDCNHSLGKMKDDPARLRAAADYIERHAAKTSTSVPASNVIPLKLKER